MNSSQAQAMTLAFIVAVTLIVVAYDIGAYRFWGQRATISCVMQVVFRRVPILYPVFWISLGILIGHLRFPCE